MPMFHNHHHTHKAGWRGKLRVSHDGKLIICIPKPIKCVHLPCWFLLGDQFRAETSIVDVFASFHCPTFEYSLCTQVCPNPHVLSMKNTRNTARLFFFNYIMLTWARYQPLSHFLYCKRQKAFINVFPDKLSGWCVTAFISFRKPLWPPPMY